MSDYTIEIQASNADGTIWQALAPAETVSTDDATAEDVARAVAANQTIAEGSNWRVCVWEGAGADTGVEPVYVLDAVDAADYGTARDMTQKPTVTVGAERAAFLADPAYHGAFTDLGNGVVAIDLELATQLPEDSDGHVSDGQLWMGGVGYPITYGTLMDADTAEPIGPATAEQRAASDAAGETGTFLVDKDGDPCDASADPQVFGPIRTVYVQP